MNQTVTTSNISVTLGCSHCWHKTDKVADSDGFVECVCCHCRKKQETHRDHIFQPGYSFGPFSYEPLKVTY